jgi:hypothetical protein
MNLISSHFIMVALSFLSIWYPWQLSSNLSKLKSQYEFYLCTKTFHKELKKLNKDIEYYNTLISGSEIISKALLFFPQFKATELTVKKAKSLFQNIQNAKLISYWKNMYQIQKNSCFKSNCTFSLPTKQKALFYLKEVLMEQL